MEFLEFFQNFLENQMTNRIYFFNLLSMGTILSFLMILFGLIIFKFFKKKNEI